jgi:hypothetical protein
LLFSGKPPRKKEKSRWFCIASGFFVPLNERSGSAAFV